jgi:hypothetical protein
VLTIQIAGCEKTSPASRLEASQPTAASTEAISTPERQAYQPTRLIGT